jgi:CRP/FNR family transcriptional regulator, cyclic AMP receptor protein
MGMSMERPSVERLQALPLFGGISEPSLQRFADQADVRAFAAGEELFREGDPARSLFVIQDGRVEVFKKAAGREVHLTILGGGDCVGEMSFLDMQPRAATVRAVEPTVTWMWTYQQIHGHYCGDQKCVMLLVMNMARELSRRLRRADDQLCQFVKSTTPAQAFLGIRR